LTVSPLKTAVKRALATGWGWKLARLGQGPVGAAVLTYHRVGTASDVFPNLPISVFRSHMLWLKQHCSVIAPDDLRERATHPSRRQSVLVTFDDGYRDYHDHVYPVLDELKIPAVVFLTTAFMDDPARLFWWDMLDLATRRAPRPRARMPWARDTAVPLTPEPERLRFLKDCKNYLREVPDADKPPLLAALLAELEVDPTGLEAPRQALSWDEVRATMGLTRYGGHTHTHPLLSHLGPAQLDTEILTCRNRIHAETGIAPTWFAYPNGRACDFTAQAKGTLRHHGFDTAFTTVEGINGPDTDWMEIKRIPGSGSIPEFAWAVSGMSDDMRAKRPARTGAAAGAPD